MLEQLGALNRLAGTSGLGLNAVCNELAGTSGLDAVGALNVLNGTSNVEWLASLRKLNTDTAGANLIANPSFETDTAGWTGDGATVTRISTDGIAPGASCLRVVNSAASAGAYNDGLATTAGTFYTMQGYVKVPAGQAAQSLHVGVSWYGPAAFYEDDPGPIRDIVDGDNWVYFSYTTEAPAGSDTAYPWVYASDADAGSIWLLDVISFAETGLGLPIS